jgi:hypothetical protein
VANPHVLAEFRWNDLAAAAQAATASPLGHLLCCCQGKLIGAIETADECETIEKAAKAFKQDPATLIAVQRRLRIPARKNDRIPYPFDSKADLGTISQLGGVLTNNCRGASHRAQ